MSIEEFGEGVAPGGLKNLDEIKILICYLLKSVGKPLSFDNLNEIVQHDGLCNYFGFANAVHELLTTGHIDIVCDGETELYKTTSLGVETAALLERRLPKSVREKAINAAVKLLARVKRESENTVEMVENKSGGCFVTCKVLDMGDALMEVKLLVADRQQVERIKQQFQSCPDIVYKGVLALMTGDVRAAAELIKQADNVNCD